MVACSFVALEVGESDWSVVRVGGPFERGAVEGEVELVQWVVVEVGSIQCACRVRCSVCVMWLVNVAEVRWCEHNAFEELGFVVVFLASVFPARIAKPVLLTFNKVEVSSEDCGLFVVVWDLFSELPNRVLPVFVGVAT